MWTREFEKTDSVKIPDNHYDFLQMPCISCNKVQQLIYVCVIFNFELLILDSLYYRYFFLIVSITIQDNVN